MPPLPPHVKELPKLYLQQGEVVVTREPLVVQTTLGSCVSVVVHDPLTKLGAMCHAVMPAAESAGERSLRYADRAVSHLISVFAREGIPASRLHVKLIGGAVASMRDIASQPTPVGPLNVEVALAGLGRHGFKVSARDTGGRLGRRVLFVVPTGEVFVHALTRRPGDA